MGRFNCRYKNQVIFYSNWKGIVVYSEWMIVVSCQTSNFPAILWWEQVAFQWDDDDVHFIDQQALLDFYSASSLKQKSAVGTSLHSDILSWFQANHSLLLQLPVLFTTVVYWFNKIRCVRSELFNLLIMLP